MQVMSAAVDSILPKDALLFDKPSPLQDVMIRRKTKMEEVEEEVGPDSTVTTTWQMYNSDVFVFCFCCTRGVRKQEVEKNKNKKVTEGGDEQQDNTAF